MPDRIYRLARPEDAGVICKILVEGNLSPVAYEDMSDPGSSRIGGVFTVVCEENSQPVGVLRWRSLADEAEILDVAVFPANRRRGCAAFLLRNFLQQMTASGVRQIFLEVRESNAPAIALYKTFGFAPAGRRPNYYRNPNEAAMVMTFTAVRS